MSSLVGWFQFYIRIVQVFESHKSCVIRTVSGNNKDMRSIQLTILAIFFLIPIQLWADSIEIIDTKPKEKADYYPWITFLSKGPADLFTENVTFQVNRRAYRVVVLNDEIYTIVFIEETISGDEGCCVRIASIRKLDLDQIYKKFGIFGEISSFKFIKWQSATSFEFSIHKRRFLLTDIDKKQVLVREL